MKIWMFEIYLRNWYWDFDREIYWPLWFPRIVYFGIVLCDVFSLQGLGYLLAINFDPLRWVGIWGRATGISGEGHAVRKGGRREGLVPPVALGTFVTRCSRYTRALRPCPFLYLSPALLRRLLSFPSHCLSTIESSVVPSLEPLRSRHIFFSLLLRRRHEKTKLR